MKVSIVLGTRPEAIKLIPVINALRQIDGLSVPIWSSGQHRDLVNRTMKIYGLHPDLDLDLGDSRDGQTLTDTVTRVMQRLQSIIEREKPNWVIVQGDTSTATAGALTCCYHGIKVAHLEAGLRSNNRLSPFPEEINRRLISQLADFHFAQDSAAKSNLLNEGIDPKNVLVVGNTGLDLLVQTLRTGPGHSGMNYKNLGREDSRLILVTVHRRETIGEPLISICDALRRLTGLTEHKVEVVFPVHPNPKIQEMVYSLLGNAENIHLLDPQDYPAFLVLLERASVILSDSGGIQEEAAFLEKPLLVLREHTERSLAKQSHGAKLVGSDSDLIVKEVAAFLRRPRDQETHIARKLSAYHMAAPLVARQFAMLADSIK